MQRRRSPLVLLAALAASAAPSSALGEAEESARDALLRAPTAAPRASFFHAALEIPPLETARPLPSGTVYARLSSSHAYTDESRIVNGFRNRFTGVYHEWGRVEISAGAPGGLELGASLNYAGWDEALDRFFLYDRTGRVIVRDEEPVIRNTGTSNRHDNLSRVTARAKLRLLEGDEGRSALALATSWKFPVGRDDDLTHAGTYDGTVTLLGTLALGELTLHANLGGVFPLGRQRFFERDLGIDLNPFVQGAFGANLRIAENAALVAQLEAHQSAFEEVEFLSAPPATVFGGLRWMPGGGGLVLEAGAGTGLNHNQAANLLATASVGYAF